MKKKNYTCPLCRGKVTNKRISLDLWVGHHLIVIKKVPADVCEVCGEEAFSPPVSKKIDRLVRHAAKPDSHTMVPVFNLA